MLSQLSQRLAACSQDGKRLNGCVDKARQSPACAFHPYVGRECSSAGILVAVLAVEQVVGDLEGQSDVVCVGLQCLYLVLRNVYEQGGESHRKQEQTLSPPD